MASGSSTQESIQSLLAPLTSAMAAAGMDAVRIGRVSELIRALHQRGAVGLREFTKRLARAAERQNQFAGFQREGFCARQLAEVGAAVTFEPLGAKGPDLLAVPHGTELFVEVKRFTESAGQSDDDEDLESWFRNEAAPSENAGGPKRLTGKVLDVIYDAYSQTVEGAANVLVLFDFSPSITRSNFLDGVKGLRQEIELNQTYAELGGVVYRANWWFGDRPSDGYLWLNRDARTPIPPRAEQLLKRALRVETVS